jgi:3-phosphoshikimate 1-carboxyvinyltransferase
MKEYPRSIEIVPLSRPPNATVRVPGSKSITNRALLLAALGRCECLLIGALRSEDTDLMAAALRTLGVGVETGNDESFVVHGVGGSLFPVDHADLFLGNSGTSMRFMTAALAAGHGRYRLDGVPRMRERPIEDLLSALRQLGANVYSEMQNGCPPVIVETSGLRGGNVHIKGDVSSQFLSAVLMVAPLAESDVIIEVDGPLVSEPYVNMTVAMMRQFGATIEVTESKHFVIRQGVRTVRTYGRLHVYDIEPDASAASYFFGAAAITGGRVGIQLPENLVSTVLQGDFRFVDLLKQMGCRPSRSGGEAPWLVRGAPLHGIDTDMNDISDTVMTLAAVACFADGPTTIRNVAHIRHKETDRLAALATELRRVGAHVDEFADGLTITPRPLHGAEIETYNDHRMAMSMALIGLKVPGIVIKNPGCVAKTYPRFFDDLEKLR